MPPNQKQDRNRQDSKDEDIVIVDDDEENNKPKEDTLADEGIKDELKEETHVVQDIEQEDEDIEEEDNLEG